MPKQIKADLDQVVEAVMEQFRKDGIVMAMYLDYGGDDINLVVDTPSGTDSIRTALEQFVVADLCPSCKGTKKIHTKHFGALQCEDCTPTKGGSNG